MTASEKEILIQRIETALDTVRPHLKVDGGDVELVDVNDEMQVKIKWLGMCEGCAMSAMTLQAGIKEAVISQIPEIASVEAVNGLETIQ